jgi:hypothetical protein
MSDHLATASAENPPSSQRQWTGLTLIGYSPLAQRKKLANEPCTRIVGSQVA